MTCVQPNKTDSIITYPGKHNTVSLFAVDFHNQSVVAEVIVTGDIVHQINYTNITKYEKQLLNQGQCTDIVFTLPLVKDLWKVVLSFAVIDEEIHIDVHVTVLPCPIGFYSYMNVYVILTSYNMVLPLLVILIQPLLLSAMGCG